MSPLTELLLTNGLMTSAAFVLLWLVATLKRDASIVDLYWGLGFAVVAWTSVVATAPATQRTAVMAWLTTIWGVRLSVHLCRRNWGRGEDRRYAAMRARHGRAFPRVSLFTVFLLQATVLWIVSLPIPAAAAAESNDFPKVLDVPAIALWSVGFFFETVGDYQLARFRADERNEGRVMDRGLWRYTRHPNYFGDACIWWGIYLLAAAGGGAWTIVSPLLLTFLLLRVSGVSLLEQSIAERRPEYADYRARTNAFFPGPPKRMTRRQA